MSTIGKNRFVFIIWSAARCFEQRVVDEIGSRFKILRTFEVTWPRRHFRRNLAALYGWQSWFCWWNKARKCGKGPFLVIEVEDPAPVWQRLRDTSGRLLLCNKNVHDLKILLRHMTGHSNRIHSSVTPEETLHQLAVLESKESPIPFRPIERQDGSRSGKDPISVSFCISDNFAQHLSVVIASIVVNNPDEAFVFHVLHSDVTARTESLLRQFERTRRNVKITFHKIDDSAFNGGRLPLTLTHVTKEAYYRLLLPDVLPKEDSRTIYMDVDVLCVRGGIRELWETDLRGNPVGAVLDDNTGWKRGLLGLAKGMYFCSGLLLMDLAALRSDGFVEKLLAATQAYSDKLIWMDQDVINIVFDGNIRKLPDTWNCADPYNPFRRDVTQWHFMCQTRKPWCNIWKNVTWLPYLKYLLKTPYRRNACRFAWDHVKGFFYFRYTKDNVTRYLVFGIRIWKRKSGAQP